MDPSVINVGLALGTIVAAAAGSFAGVRAGLNGVKMSQKRIEYKLDKIDDRVHNNNAEIGKIKTVCRLQHGKSWREHHDE